MLSRDDEEGAWATHSFLVVFGIEMERPRIDEPAPVDGLSRESGNGMSARSALRTTGRQKRERTATHPG